MLARQYCLSGQSNFDRVEKEGILIQATTFGLALFNRKDKEESRFGFIVSNKVAKEATQRNRIKRALKAAVRYSLGEIKKGFDVIFLAKQFSLRMSTDEIMREVKETLIKADLIQ
jgi:ribonuclease P protein component